MVAVRSRTAALAFAALMLMSTIVIVVPTAAAGHTLTDLEATVALVMRDGVPMNQNPPTSTVRVGDKLNLSVTFDASTTGCTGINNPPPTFDVTADLSAFQSGGAALDLDRHGTGANPYTYYRVIDVTAFATGVNGAPTAIEVTVTSTCATHIPVDGTDVEATDLTPQFTLDNVVPTVAVATLPAGQYGIGTFLPVNLTITGSAANYSIHTDELNNSATPMAGTTFPALHTITIMQTGFDNAVPKIYVGDAGGNVVVAPFPSNVVVDAKAPLLTGAAMVARQGTFVEFNFTPHESDPSNADVARYNVQFDTVPAGGSPVLTATCLKTGTGTNCAHSSTTGIYNISSPSLAANTLYGLTIRAFDDANNPSASPLTTTVTTAPALSGTVEWELAEPLPFGGIGSQVNLALRGLAVDVNSVQVNAAQFGVSTPVVWGGTSGVALTANQTITVGPGVESPAFSAIACGSAGCATQFVDIGVANNDASPRPVDAKAPDAAIGLTATARPDGTVKLDWQNPTGVGNSDRVGYTLTVTPSSLAPISIAANDVTYTVNGLTSGTQVTLSLAGRDEVGNVGTPAVRVTTPTALPIFAAIDPTPTDDAWPTLAGTWLAVDGLSPAVTGGAGIIMVAVNRSVPSADTDIYWNPTTKLWQAGFVAANASFTTGTTGAWTASNFTDVINGTASGNGENNGNYTFTVIIRNETSGLTYNATPLLWHRDLVPPVFSTAAGKNNIVSGADGTLANTFMQGLTVNVNLALNDSDGIGTIRYALVNPASTPVANKEATNLDGAPLVITCPTDPNCLGGPAIGAKSFDGTVGLRFTRPAMGVSYKLNVTVFDASGNKITDANGFNAQGNKTLATAFTLTPRVVLAEGSDTPGIGTDGRLRLRGYAAWNGSEAFDGNPNGGNSLGACPENVCRVQKVEYYIRAGTTGTGTLLGSEFIPVAGPDHSIDPTVKFYNYTPGSFAVPSSIDGANAYVQARTVGYTSTQTTSGVAAQTAWIRIRTIETPGGLSVRQPFYDGGTFMNGTVGTTNFSVLLDQAGLSTTPVVNYSIRDATPGRATLGKYVYIHAATSATDSPLSVIRNRTNPLQTGTQYYYNWSNNVTLAPGIYDLNVTATTPGNSIQASRRFTVEDDGPTLGALTAVSDIFADKYVRTEFNFTLNVSHGYASVNSSGLKLVMVDNAGATVPENQRVFETTLLDPTDETPVGNSTYLVRVRLPSTAVDATRYDMRFNLTTESITTCACRTTSATFVRTVSLDAGAGTSTVDVDATRATGALLSNALAVKGTATDAGTGVAQVQVRVVNLSGTGSTWRPSFGTFLPGILDGPEYYLTNTTAGALQIKSKVRDGGGNEIASWEIASGSGSTGVSFDRGSRYFIDVRSTDLAGYTSAWRNATVTFDGEAPALSLFNFTGGVATNTVDWHGAGTFSAFARDNACVDRVVLVVARGDGASASANFTRPASAICSATTGNTAANWTLDLAANPTITDYVGTNRYRVEAYDPVGNRVGLVQNITLTVRDVTAPIVRAVSFEPGTLGAGLPATVLADVFENANISRVELLVARRETPDTILGRGNMTPRNVTPTGTGLWEARISTEANSQVNITLERGEYLFRVRPLDVNAAVTCPSNACAYSDFLKVVVEGNPPQIVAKAPTGTYVNASPTFRYEVLDLGLNAAGVSVHTGYDGALTEVPRSTLTFVESKGANNSTLGQVVSYTPATPLTDGPNYTVRVVVQSTRSGFRSTFDSTFTVDATPPTASDNVTGTLPMNNKTYAVALTRVALNATDNETANPSIRYRVNGGAEQTYSTPITPSGEDGEWRLEYWARDSAGNDGPRKNVTLQIDRTGPRISVNSHGDVVILTVNDDGVGVNDSTVTVQYRYGTTGGFTPLTATRIAGGNSFRATLPGNASATGLSYYFTALDDLGNQGTNFSAAGPHVIPPTDDETPPPPENEPPTITIEAPTDGATVSRSVDIRWTATDPEFATLTVIVARNNPDRVIMQPASDPGHFVWNLTGEPVGATTVVVTVIDGVHEITDTVTFNVVAPQTIVARPIPQTPVQPGAGIPIEVAINPTGTTVTSATYSLVRNGTTIPGGPLTRNAAGNYVAVVSANQSGVYAVVVDVVYGNQTTETRSIGQFAVAPPAQPPVVTDPAKSFPVSLMTLAALAVLTIALAAYGAFGRWRK